jgi:hypothetical protein
VDSVDFFVFPMKNGNPLFLVHPLFWCFWAILGEVPTRKFAFFIGEIAFYTGFAGNVKQLKPFAMLHLSGLGRFLQTRIIE